MHFPSAGGGNSRGSGTSNSHTHHSHLSRNNGHNSGHNIFNVNNAPTGRRETISDIRSPSWWKPKSSSKPPIDSMTGLDLIDRTGGNTSSSSGGHKKGRAWLLIVAAGIAVGVACLIVCFLGVGRRLFIREKHKQSTVINYSI